METILFKVEKVLRNIRARRCEMNLTQYDMADKLSMSQHGYGKIENGFSQLSIERFMAIAEALDTPFTHFIDV
ncbi:helix-turn-helix transcriptional regulator [Mucilaginibacter corticis]|uniref:Helix-turn-helix transcriptional regulator n=1 Tax=Mucilaginibacter corticis TaxID=2597670 RepID=A0A556M8Z9_9SPHI|nr:helix-turn-helix transcriptional regulator [Mucilaginibacter corticis]TSJ36331.1 helix-turn-helix transcriptional regulator [Mucilaginibacter corticis]